MFLNANHTPTGYYDNVDHENTLLTQYTCTCMFELHFVTLLFVHVLLHTTLFGCREDWKPVLTINSIVYGLQFLFLVSTRDVLPQQMHVLKCTVCYLLGWSTPRQIRTVWVCFASIYKTDFGTRSHQGMI